MIAESKCRRKGLAKEAALLMMGYGRHHLKATSFVAKITDGNDASNSMFEKLEFDMAGHEYVFYHLPLHNHTNKMHTSVHFYF